MEGTGLHCCGQMSDVIFLLNASQYVTDCSIAIFNLKNTVSKERAFVKISLTN